MNITKFKNWKTLNKIYFLLIISILPIVLLILFYILPKVKNNLYDEKREATRKSVEIAFSIFDKVESKVASNQLTTEQAHAEAKSLISSLRYSGENYFWINDVDCKMVMHPMKPELDGTDLRSNQDPTGKYIFVEFVKIATEKGAGFVEYMWPKPGADKPLPKISYVKLYSKWGWIIGSGIYVDDVEAEVSSLLQQLVISLIIIVCVVLIMGYFFSRRLSKPLFTLKELANRVAVGDVDFILKSSSKDEIGQLETSFSHMVQNIKDQSKMAEKLADGDMGIEVNVKSDKDILSKSMVRVVGTLKDLVSETVDLSNAAIEGKLSTRGDADKFQGGYRDIISGVNETLNMMIEPIDESNKVLDKLASGDLTVRMEGDYKGDYVIIKNSINALTESFEKAISEVTDAAQATASASSEISASIEEMASGSDEQNRQTSEIASAVEQMTKTILENTNNLSGATDAAKNAGAIAKEGGRIVNETIEGMNRISSVVSKSAETVKALGNSSDQIGEIIEVIDDIASQTNLLALNAAIEAARAGEQGRGFAVVADEVKKLAEKTTKATKEIAAMIKHIQKETVEAVTSIQQGTVEVEKGKRLADKAGQSLSEIIKGSETVVDMVAQVTVASEEQSGAAEEISKSIDAISNVTNESALGIQQIARASEDLNRLTENLHELVLRFKINKQVVMNSETSHASGVKKKITKRYSTR